ncbi:MAG: hypothetical protein JXB00_19560 [Bacteroidales bacterium]|nr:hypothetical protein [Bacteroidales bacterium]
MARVKKGSVVKGLSGRVGKSLVFKTYGDITIVSKYPDMSKVVPTEKQKNENGKFRDAMAWVKVQMSDQEIKQLYKAKTNGLQRPHNIALADYYNPPVINSVEVSIAQPSKADQVLIDATDDFMVTRVEVEIKDANGNQTEKGMALHMRDNKWLYAVKRIYPSSAGLKITVRAWDRPENCTEKTV